MAMNPRLLRPTSGSDSPASIPGLALWLDAAAPDALYTTDAGPVTAVGSPLDISGCALWLDGADSSAASMTLDGTAVSAWRDKSGNGRDFTAAGGARPTITASGLNGRSVVTFDGTDDQLTNATNIVGLANVTMLAVAYRQTGAYGGIISSATTTDSSPALLIENTNVAVRGYGNISVQIGGFTGPAVISGRVSSGATELFTDGLARDSDAVSGTLNAATTTAIGTYRQAAQNFLSGYIAEIIVYPAALSASDRARVEAYLATKWGISNVHAPAVTASQPVGYWRDRSGNGRHATQSTAASRPVVGTQNGRRALSANGTSQWMSMPNALGVARNAPGLTIMAAVNPNTASGARSVAFWSVGTSSAARSLLQFENAAVRAGGRRNDADSFDSATAGVITANQPMAAIASLDYANARATAFVNGVAFAEDASFLTAGNTSDTDSQAASIMSSAGSLFYSGVFAELAAWPRVLTLAERRKVERYLARRWGITLAPQVSNAEAQDWINRVYANGGTVSTSTASAVSTFCDAIDAAGIRDRFLRLNLFCGTGLNACLVPLYRAASIGGTQLGNVTDTNVGGLFVSANYVETGASGGLQSTGTKWLDTGFATNTLAEGNRHISVYENAKATRSLDVSIGSEGATGNTQHFLLGTFNTADSYRFAFGATSAAVDAGSYSGGAMWLGVNQSAGQGILYKNGTSAVTGTVTAASPTSASVFIFALNRAGSGADGSDARLGSYSIGLSMTALQAAAYYTAMQSFQAALTRNV